MTHNMNEIIDLWYFVKYFDNYSRELIACGVVLAEHRTCGRPFIYYI